MRSRLAKLGAFFRRPRVAVPLLATSGIVATAGLGFVVFGDWVRAVIAALAILLIGLVAFLLWSIVARDRERRIESGLERRDLRTEPERARREERGPSLEQVFTRGLAVWKSSIRSRNLPWYIVLGEEGAGKSALIEESGLGVPADVARPLDRGPTRRCAWWPTNRAILLDTAGRYLDSRDSVDRKEWRRLLRLIRRHGARTPVRGILLAVPISRILALDAKAREDYAHAVRRRLNEIASDLRVEAPIYVMITKVDQIEGLLETAHLLPRARLDEAIGWTHGSRAFRDAGESFLRRFGETIESLERILPDLLVREPDPERRRKALMLPQELDAVARAIASFLTQSFGRSVYGEVPFLRGVYLTSARQSGATLSPVLDEMGLSWARGSVDAFAPKRSLFVRDLFAKVVIDEEEAELAWSRRRLGPLSRRTLLAMGSISAAASTALLVGSFALEYRGIERLREDTRLVLRDNPGARTLERLRARIASESAGAASFWRRMGLAHHTEAALRRSEQSFAVAFGREYEDAAKTNLLDSLRTPGARQFASLAELALDVHFLARRGEVGASAQPELRPYLDRRSPDVEPVFPALYATFARVAPDALLRERIDRETRALEQTSPRLLTLENLESWCAENPASCPGVDYVDFGLPSVDRSDCGPVPGAYTRAIWSDVVYALVQAVRESRTLSRPSLEEFVVRYRETYLRQWRRFLLCTPTDPIPLARAQTSPYLALLETARHQLDAPDLFREPEHSPAWSIALAEALRDAPLERAPGDPPETIPPALEYRAALTEVAEQAETARATQTSALELARQVSREPTSAFAAALRVADRIAPLAGDDGDREVARRIREILALPILNALSAVLDPAARELDRIYRGQIAPASMRDGPGSEELRALYGRDGAVERFEEALEPFYRDGRSVALLRDRKIWLAPTFRDWLAHAQTMRRLLFSESARTLRLRGVPPRFDGPAGVVLVRQELRLDCRESTREYAYASGSLEGALEWSNDCDDVELLVWVEERGQGQRELRKRKTWPGPLGLSDFLRDGEPRGDGRYAWELRYDEGTVELEYRMSGEEELRLLAHRRPPPSILE